LALLSTLQAGNDGGPFLLGMTATPFRRDQRNLSDLFGHPTATLDLIEGMRRGFLANVDYRLHTDNIDWTRLRALNGSSFSPANINKTLFIQEWDDAVVHELQQVWGQVDKPRAIVFCGTIEHAIMTRDRINSLSFCRAEALYSQSDGRLLPASERSRLLCDFQDGRCQVICAVDILNEGIDVPDVNIIVFQRVTHSRRIFVQQLGRGLRIAPGKESVIVLDFVSDIRRFAAGLEMQRSLNVAEPGAVCARIGHKVRFARRSAEDIQAQRFITEWLSDAGELQDCPDEVATLRFPPTELLEIH
jgi:superfamily II DNA or RNA helicase